MADMLGQAGDVYYENAAVGELKPDGGEDEDEDEDGNEGEGEDEGAGEGEDADSMSEAEAAIHLEELWLTTTPGADVWCLEGPDPWSRRYICSTTTHGQNDERRLSKGQKAKASIDWRRNDRRRGGTIKVESDVTTPELSAWFADVQEASGPSRLFDVPVGTKPRFGIPQPRLTGLVLGKDLLVGI
ncbi:hypothetical protein HJFPF1_03756 [Paramyrothecium foliicola]|nr:hypothetical protein HJFPF1_03756 [Paramyrothecium foliicola]